jgi:hypothetical protein
MKAQQDPAEKLRARARRTEAEVTHGRESLVLSAEKAAIRRTEERILRRNGRGELALRAGWGAKRQALDENFAGQCSWSRDVGSIARPVDRALSDEKLTVLSPRFEL